MDYRSLMSGVWLAVVIAGIVLMLNGAVQLAVRNKTGPWKDGGANFLAGIIVAGVSIGLMVWLGFRLIPPPG
jgi:VIT1/CCC1 family predicted Fe2+/Mn2+ transporter